MSTLVIGGEQVRQVLSMDDCIEIIADTFEELSMGRIWQPLRSFTRLPDRRDLLAMMPALAERRGVMGLKALTVFPNNHDQGLSSHQGVVILFDSHDGRLLAVIDAESITEIRTAAASGVATRTLAMGSARSLAILGTGAQARGHLRSTCLVRDIEQVRVWDLDRHAADRFARNETDSCTAPIVATTTAQEAVEGAQIICTLTPAKQPIVNAEWIQAGAHINAVGACTPDASELDPALMARCLLFADSRESLFNEAGDFLIPLRAGVIGEDVFRGELGDVLTGSVPGRQGDSDITVFESLGLASEDIAAAQYVYQCCSEREIGTHVAI